MEGVLKVRDLALARSGVRILENLSFCVDAGRVLVVRGPNGIGKTTLLRSLAGLHPPDHGAIEVPEGSLVYAGHAHGTKSMLTVGETLEFWAEIYASPGVAAALSAFGLHGLRDCPAGALSAGQRRRLGLARLVVAQCALWILDEPTTSLDGRATAQLQSVLHGHLAQGGSAVIALHTAIEIKAADELDLAPYAARSTL